VGVACALGIVSDEKRTGTANCYDDAIDTNNLVVGTIGVVRTHSAALHFRLHKKHTGVRNPSLHCDAQQRTFLKNNLPKRHSFRATDRPSMN
jgi:hypothetical protein